MEEVVETEEKGISIIKLLKVMFHRKLVMLCIVAGTILFGCLGIKFFYNAGAAKYKSEYTYSVGAFNSNGRYIDGSNFYFNNLKSKKVLEEVKSIDEKFKNINIDKIIRNNAIDIQWANVYEDRDEDGTKELVNTYYILKIKKTYFKSEEQAKDFVEAIINYPIEKNKKLQNELNYEASFERYNNAESYETQIACLQGQLDFLIAKYDSLISEYGDVNLSATYNNLKLSVYRNDLSTYFSNNPLSDFSIEVVQNGYVKDYENRVAILQYRVKDLQDTKEDNLKIIEDLETKRKILIDSFTGGQVQNFEIATYNARIAELTEANVRIDRSIIELNKQIDNGNTTPTNFSVRLDVLKDKLINETKKLKAIEKEVMEDYSQVFYMNTNIVKQEGGLSMILSVLITAVVGLVIGCVVNLILDNKYLYEDFPPKVSKKKEEVVPEEAKQ